VRSGGNPWLAAGTLGVVSYLTARSVDVDRVKAAKLAFVLSAGNIFVHYILGWYADEIRTIVKGA